MRNGNPALKKGFKNYPKVVDGTSMTMGGTVNKAFILLSLLMVTTVYSWMTAIMGNVDLSMTLLIVGGIGGTIVAITTAFIPKICRITAPIYALLEGLVIGTISVFAEMQFPGIAFQAVMLTISILFVLLILYKARIIQATDKFKLGVYSATLGICIVYSLSFILRLIGINVYYIHDSGIVGIGISLLVVIVAALNLILDFDFIETGVKRGLPSYMEWYGAFGLLVTLVWLYMEALRLIAKLRSDD